MAAGLNDETPVPVKWVWGAVSFVVSLLLLVLWQAVEIKQDIRALKYGTWTISDQEEFERQAAQGGLILPNTRLIIRERLPGPLHQP